MAEAPQILQIRLIPGKGARRNHLGGVKHLDQNLLVGGKLLLVALPAGCVGSASPRDGPRKGWWHQEPSQVHRSILQRCQTWPGVTLCSLALPRASCWLQICWGCRQIIQTSALGGEINFPAGASSKSELSSPWLV